MIIHPPISSNLNNNIGKTFIMPTHVPLLMKATLKHVPVL